MVRMGIIACTGFLVVAQGCLRDTSSRETAGSRDSSSGTGGFGGGGVTADCSYCFQGLVRFPGPCTTPPPYYTACDLLVSGVQCMPKGTPCPGSLDGGGQPDADASGD